MPTVGRQQHPFSSVNNCSWYNWNILSGNSTGLMGLEPTTPNYMPSALTTGYIATSMTFVQTWLHKLHWWVLLPSNLKHPISNNKYTSFDVFISRDANHLNYVSQMPTINCTNYINLLYMATLLDNISHTILPRLIDLHATSWGIYINHGCSSVGLGKFHGPGYSK